MKNMLGLLVQRRRQRPVAIRSQGCKRRRPNGDDSLTTRPSGGPTVASMPLIESAMVLNPETKYPNRRAYVLKLRGDARPDALTGRIENLATGRQLDFASGQQLLELLAGDLEAVATDSARDAAVG
jgi:hypothetical protein